MNKLIFIALLFLLPASCAKQVQVPLSSAIQLSTNRTFSELALSRTEAKLTVAEGVTFSVNDTKGKMHDVQTGDYITADTDQLTLKDLQELGMVLPAKYEAAKTSGVLGSIVGLFAPLIVMVALVVVLYVFMTDSKIKMFKPAKNNNTTFADVGGLGSVKDSLNDVISFLKDKEYLSQVGAKSPHGVLLSGSPGVGKTLISKAMAAEAKVPFFYASASEFHTMWVGLSGQIIKKLFKKAKKQPSIIFIDEFDSIGQRRSFGGSDVSREFDHTLNQLLAEMDGFEKSKSPVIVIAATNNPEVLDPAIVRPGRFDRHIAIPLPTYSERCEIVAIHRKGKKLPDSVTNEVIAKETSGMSGADLSLLLNEAAIRAGKRHADEITLDDINQSLDKVTAGDERKSLVLSNEEKRIIAYHEAGHALVAASLPNYDKVQRVSILPRGISGGFVRTNSEKESLLKSKTSLTQTITVLLSGRVSEELIIGDISNGACNDLQQANKVAYEMVSRFGMGERFGLKALIKENEQSQVIIEADVTDIIVRCYADAKKILSDKREILDKIATRLLEVETLTGDELESVINA